MRTEFNVTSAPATFATNRAAHTPIASLPILIIRFSRDVITNTGAMISRTAVDQKCKRRHESAARSRDEAPHHSRLAWRRLCSRHTFGMSSIRRAVCRALLCAAVLPSSTFAQVADRSAERTITQLHGDLYRVQDGGETTVFLVTS